MLRIYDEFLEDETIRGLRDRSYRLHMSGLIYCAKNLTDGLLTGTAVKVLQVLLGFPVRRHVDELVEKRLWVVVDDGHEIRNYLEFNPPAELVKRERSAARKRMKELREKRVGSPESSGERSGEHSGERSGAVPSLTSPLEIFPKAVSPQGSGTAPGLNLSNLNPHLREIA